MEVLKTASFKCSVSSTLNKDIKLYGKQNMFDDKEDTSWSTNEGSPQWISLVFNEPQSLSAFSIQFQGGFAGKDIVLIVESVEGAVIYKETFYPEDVNLIQCFKLKKPVTNMAHKIKLVFASSTDFFGRIIVYTLKFFS